MSRAGAPDPVKRLRRNLEALVWPASTSEKLELAYRGPTDFVLQHGEVFEPRPLPDIYWKGLQRHCFGNAINSAVVYGLDYVEGYAIGDPAHGGDPDLPIHHGWNVTEDGLLVDTTWWKPGIAYLGVRFSVERADDASWNGDASILDDWQRGWRLLQDRWEGEPAGLVWATSLRLEAIRLYAAGDVAGARALAAEGFAE